MLALSSCERNNSTKNPNETGEKAEVKRESEIETEIESEIETEYISPDEMMERCVVQIVADGLIGSGVVYEITEEKVCIVTAAHVLEETKGDVFVCFPGDVVIGSTEIYCADRMDLAFVWLDKILFDKKDLEKVYLTKKNKEIVNRIEKDADVVMIGSATGPAKQYYKGSIKDPYTYIEQLKHYMMLINGECDPGMSGGGVFNEEGYFLGIICESSSAGATVVIPDHVISSVFNDGVKGRE